MSVYGCEVGTAHVSQQNAEISFFLLIGLVVDRKVHQAHVLLNYN